MSKLRRVYRTRDARRGTGVISGAKTDARRLVTYVSPEVYEALKTAARSAEVSNSAMAAQIIERGLVHYLAGP